MYPYLSAWLEALRKSENGLLLVLITAGLSVLLLTIYRWMAPYDFAKLRTTLVSAFIIISLVLIVVVG